MKKEIGYCDVCGKEASKPLYLKPMIEVDTLGFPKKRPLEVQIVLAPRDEGISPLVDLCDRDRLRVLESAVEQMKVTV